MEKREMKNEALIIGAGIAGCSAAYALCKKGWNVTVFEKSSAPATQSSGNPCAIISPSLTAKDTPENDFYRKAFIHTTNLLNTLPKTDWQNSGLLELSLSDTEAKTHQKISNLNPDLAQSIPATKASKIAGIPLTQSALFISKAGHITPSIFCDALLKACGKGLTMRFNCPILDFKKIGGHWKLYSKDKALIATTKTLILAQGDMISQKINWLPTHYLGGHMIKIPEAKNTAPLKTILRHEGYVLPSRKTSTHKNIHFAGATFQPLKKPEDKIIDQTQKLIQKIYKNIPTLKFAQTDISMTRTGVRVTTPDHLPLFGAIPDKKYWQQEFKSLKDGKISAKNISSHSLNALLSSTEEDRINSYKSLHLECYRKPSYPKKQNPHPDFNPEIATKNPLYLEGLYLIGGLGSHGLTTAPYLGEMLAIFLTSPDSPSKKDNILWQHLLSQRFLIRDLKRCH